jgi:hypothetical protein
LKERKILNQIGMAATVRAVFEIVMLRTSVQCKSVVREERESDVTIGRIDPVARQARHFGFGRNCGASGGATNGRTGLGTAGLWARIFGSKPPSDGTGCRCERR